MLPEIQELAPLPGALVEDFKKCGSRSCRCASGQLHGPYLVRVWYDGGKRRKTYVKAKDAPAVRGAIKLWETQRRLSKLRTYSELRISKRDRQLVQAIIDELEAEAEALKKLRPGR